MNGHKNLRFIGRLPLPFIQYENRVICLVDRMGLEDLFQGLK